MGSYPAETSAGRAELCRHQPLSLGAALAVPVVNNLTLNLNVNARIRLLGAYGLPRVISGRDR